MSFFNRRRIIYILNNCRINLRTNIINVKLKICIFIYFQFLFTEFSFELFVEILFNVLNIKKNYEAMYIGCISAINRAIHNLVFANKI